LFLDLLSLSVSVSDDELLELSEDELLELLLEELLVNEFKHDDDVSEFSSSELELLEDLLRLLDDDDDDFLDEPLNLQRRPLDPPLSPLSLP